MPRHCAAGLLASIAACAAPAQEPQAANLIELEWRTTPSGSLGILPNPAMGGATREPLVLFGPLTTGRESMWCRLRDVALRHFYTWLVLSAPGPRDGASKPLA